MSVAAGQTSNPKDMSDTMAANCQRAESRKAISAAAYAAARPGLPATTT